MERVTVKWFNDRNGYGFLSRGEGTPDVFVHNKVLREAGIVSVNGKSPIEPGQSLLLIETEPGPNGGVRATEVARDD